MGDHPLKLIFTSLFITLLFVQQASAGICDRLLSNVAKPGQIQILANELRERNLSRLVKAYEDAHIVEKPKRYFWQNPLSWKAQRITGKITITSRLPEWNSQEEKMKAVWQLALFLFETQVQQKLWNLRKIDHQLHIDESLLKNATPDELFGYLLVNAPTRWSKEWVDDLKNLNAELYTLLADLDVETLVKELPKRDQGRHKYRAFFFGLFVSYNPEPNQEDFATFQKQNGSQNLNSTLDKRYLRQTYLSWYTNFLKRFFMASMLASTIPAWGLAVQEAPRIYQYVSNYSEYKKEIQDTLENLTDQEKLQKAYEKNLEQTVMKKYTELVLEINRLKASQADPAKLEELQEDLAELIKKYNTILKLPNPSSP